jgi:hypothetical protein
MTKKFKHFIDEERLINEMPQINKIGTKVMADDIPLKLVKDIEKLEPNFSMYHEEKGNFVFAKGKTFLYFTKTENWGQKVVDGEYDMLMFPYAGRFNWGAAPINDVWKKSHNKNIRGADEIIGLIEAYVANGEILIQMMSVRPGYKKNSINTNMINRLKKSFPNHVVVFEDPTKAGWAFIQKYAPDAIARSSKGQELKKPYESMEAKRFEDFVNEDHVDEKLKVFMKDIIGKMVPAAFGYKTDAKMRDELKAAVADAIEPILKKYNYIVESESNDELFENGLIQNLDSDDFDGADPEKIQVWNQGIGGTRSLQGHRKRIVQLLEQMLKDAKMAEKNHKNAYYNIDKILGLANPERMGGVFLPYLKNHQIAIEELENLRKRGGSGKGRTVPRGLI